VEGKECRVWGVLRLTPDVATDRKSIQIADFFL